MRPVSVMRTMIAVASNIVRITLTGLMYEFGYADLAQQFFHDVAGWFMMPLALGMMWVELKVMKHLFIDAPATPAARALAPAAANRGGVPRPAVPRGNRRPARGEQAKPDATPAPVEQTAEKG